MAHPVEFIAPTVSFVPNYDKGTVTIEMQGLPITEKARMMVIAFVTLEAALRENAKLAFTRCDPHWTFSEIVQDMKDNSEIKLSEFVISEFPDEEIPSERH